MTQYQTPAQPKHATSSAQAPRVSPEYLEVLHMLAALDGDKSPPAGSSKG